jgi:DNA-directed RNA polymerase subunit E'
MFRIMAMEDTIRIPPDKLGGAIKKAAREQVKVKYENLIDEELGYVIYVIDVDVDPVGRILPGDGSTYHKVKFRLLTFYPELHEIVEGEVVEVTDFGAFIRIGPEDALVHVSQIMDDFITYDEKQGVLSGKETHRRICKGDHVRARVIAVSFPRGGVSGKIGLTMRQPYLGKFEWISEEIQKEISQ